MSFFHRKRTPQPQVHSAKTPTQAEPLIYGATIEAYVDKIYIDIGVVLDGHNRLLKDQVLLYQEVQRIKDHLASISTRYENKIGALQAEINRLKGIHGA